MRDKTGVAIIGPGNIGTDLMLKVIETSDTLQMRMLVGIDPESDGLARARALGVETTAEGIEGLLSSPLMREVGIVFDATSARAHLKHAERLAEHPDVRVVDLTPAAVGPFVVPVANLERGLEAKNVNMVTCGGQATIPIVWALSQVAEVVYGEIVASISSRSAGPGTRANIDEFTLTTARGIEEVGGARRGKAIIILNPAEPPMIMRDTVYAFCLSEDEGAMRDAIIDVVAKVARYVPGYRLVQEPVFEAMKGDDRVRIPGFGEFEGTKVTTFLEVEGAGHYLPRYAGNLDIMTSAGLRMGELLAEQQQLKQKEA